MEREGKIGIVNAYESAPKSQEDKFKNTIAFLKTAIAEGAHLKIPIFVSGRGGKSMQISEDAWVRQKNIIGVYFGSPAALEDIGRDYGVTRERISQLVEKSMRHLWRNCSLGTQAVFPFQELVLDKRISQRSKERASQTRGGRSILVREGIKAGRSVRQIQEEGVLSRSQILQSRYALRTWGTEVPYTITSKFQNIELEKRLKAAETDEEKQKLLNQAKRSFCRKHVEGENPLLNTLTNIVWEAGLNLGFQSQNASIFIEALKNVGIPMAEIHERITSETGEEKTVIYRFLLAKDKERAKAVLLADPNLQRFRRS